MKKGLLRRSASAFIAAAVAITGLYGTAPSDILDIAAGAEDIVISQPESDGNAEVPEKLEGELEIAEPFVVGGGEEAEEFVLDLNDNKLTRGMGNAASSTGNVITVKQNGKLTICNSAGSDAKAMIARGKNTGNGGCIIVEGGGTLILEAGTIINGSAVKGAGVYVADEGTFIMNGGSIKNCKGTYGAAVYVESGGTFEMNGGTIESCTASESGGVYVKGTFTMNGGGISANSAKSGAGVQIGIGGTFSMTGGSIINNTASESCGGVNVGTGAAFAVGGGTKSVTITGNTAAGSAENVRLAYGTVIDVAGAVAAGSAIGVTTAVPPTISSSVEITGETTELCAFLQSDDPDYKAEKQGSKAYLIPAPNDFTRLQRMIDNAAGTVTLSGNFAHYDYEDEDIGAIEIAEDQDIIIDLNGMSIDRLLGSTSAENGYVIVNYGTLRITDSSSGGKGTITGGNNSSGKGGGIYNDGTLIIDGGSVTGNKVSGSVGFGGGIYNIGTLTISGGSVANNTAGGTGSSFGGGIYNEGTLTISGGSVNNNTAGGSGISYGGGIFSTGKVTVTMTGGAVSGNTSSGAKAAYGGGVCLNEQSVFEMTDGKISGSSAKNASSAGYGGGIYADVDCSVKISGGSVTDNTAGTNAGGVYVGKALTVSGKVTIIDNKKGSAANNVFLPDKVISLEEPVTGSRIGVTTGTPPTSSGDVAFTTGYSGDFPSEIFSSDAGYYVNKAGGVAVVSLKEQFVELTQAKTAPAIKVTRGGEEVTDGTVKAGDTLTAECAASGDLTYEWYYGDDTQVPGDTDGTYATGKTYKVKLDDAGKQIYVKATQKKGADGELYDTPKTASSAKTAAITTNPKPDKPAVPEWTATTVRITITSPLDDETHDYEYKRGTNDWTDDPVFKGLTSDKEYKIYVRIKATEDTPASDAASTIAKTLGGDHTHSEFSYSAKGNVLTVKCSAANCTFGGTATLTLNAESGTYSGKAFTATLDDLESFEELTGLDINAAITYNGSETAPTEAGDYTVKAVLTFDSRKFTLVNEFTIEKTPALIEGYPSYPAANTGLVYDGKSKSLVTCGAVTGGTIYFRTGIDGSWTISPTATDPGTYKVFYYVLPDANHTGLGTENAPYGFVEVTIAGDKIAEKNVSLSPTYVEYDGGDKSFKITVVIGSKTLADGTDYTVKVTDPSGNTVTGLEKEDGRYILTNAKAGVYSILISGVTGKYAGYVTKTFTVSTKSGGMITDSNGDPLTSAPIYGDVLKALVIPDMGDLEYQWIRILDGVKTDIPGATASVYIISSPLDIGCCISVKVMSDGAVTELPATEPAEKAENLNGEVSESSLVKTPATSDTVGDGIIKINGFTSSKPMEYSTDGGKTWTAVRSGTIARLFNNMVVFLRYAGDTTHYPGPRLIVFMPSAVKLTGAEISGDTIFGETLKAVPLPAEAPYFLYEWHRIKDGVETTIDGAELNEYTLVKADMNSLIKVIISDGMERTYSATTTTTVVKRVLPAPELKGRLYGTLDNGRIWGLDKEKAYEYSSDGGKTWKAVAAGSEEITGLTEGTYTVREKISDTETETALTAEITLIFEVGDQDPPSGLTPVYVTEKGGNDGAIRGVTDKMEYSGDDGEWTAITSSPLTGLAEGTYRVRFAKVYSGEKLLKNANEPVTIIIKAKEPQSAPTGVVISGASGVGKSDGAVLNVTDAMEYSLDGGKTWTAVPEGKTVITQLSAGDEVSVRFRETDTKLAGEALELGTIGYSDRLFEVHYFIRYGGRQLTDTVSGLSFFTGDTYGISANADFFTNASSRLGLTTDKNKPRIVSYTIVSKALYTDGTQVIDETTGEPVPDMTDTVSAEEFVDNKSGIAYYGIPADCNQVCVYANIGAYATDSDDASGVLLSVTETVGFTGLPHRLTEEPSALTLTSQRSASYDLVIGIRDTKSGAYGDNVCELVYGKDYTVSYRNNVNASVKIKSDGSYETLYTKDADRPQVIIQGKGNYKSLKATVYFEILPIHLLQTGSAVGCYADAVSGSTVINKNGGITLAFAPVRYARSFNTAVGGFITDTASTVKYVTGKDITAVLQMWNASKGVWSDIGDLTDTSARKLTLQRVNTAGYYRVLLTGIGNFCGTVTDGFIVGGSGSVLFSSLKLKTTAVNYRSGGVKGEELVKSISAKINNSAVSLSDCKITLEPVSDTAAVSSDGTTALAAGTYTAYVYPKDETDFVKRYTGAVVDAPASATVKVKGSALTAKMFTTDWNKKGEAYTGRTKDIVVTLSGISASDVTIGRPASVKTGSAYVPFTESELGGYVEISGGRLIIKGGFLRDGLVWSSNANVGKYEIAFCGKNGYADSVYVYKFERIGAELKASMLKVGTSAVNVGGTVPAVTVTDPAGGMTVLVGSSSDFTVVCKNNKQPGTGTLTVKVKSDNTVFRKNSSASVSFVINKMTVSGILPYSSSVSAEPNALYIRIDETVPENKTAKYTLYQASFDGKALTALGTKDFKGAFTSAGSGSYDLTITNGESGKFDFGKGITIKSAYSTYKNKASKWTNIVIAGKAALIADIRDKAVYTNETAAGYATGSVAVSVDSKGRYSAKYAGGCYIFPNVTEITVDGRTLRLAEGWYTVTVENGNKVGSAKVTLTLTQKAAKVLGIGGSFSFTFGIIAQTNSGLAF